MAQLPPSPFISNSAASPVVADAAAAMRPPPVPAAAEPIPSNEGRHQGTPASAPSKNPDVGVLEEPMTLTLAPPPNIHLQDATDHIHEIFFYVRKLMKQPPRFVLNADAFLADVEEIPLFIREDGYLKRQA